MTDQTPENTQLFLTAAMPCPYLPGRQERKVFTELTGPHATELNDALGRRAFALDGENTLVEWSRDGEDG